MRLQMLRLHLCAEKNYYYIDDRPLLCGFRISLTTIGHVWGYATGFVTNPQKSLQQLNLNMTGSTDSPYVFCEDCLEKMKDPFVTLSLLEI